MSRTGWARRARRRSAARQISFLRVDDADRCLRPSNTRQLARRCRSTSGRAPVQRVGLCRSGELLTCIRVLWRFDDTTLPSRSAPCYLPLSGLGLSAARQAPNVQSVPEKEPLLTAGGDVHGGDVRIVTRTFGTGWSGGAPLVVPTENSICYRCAPRQRRSPGLPRSRRAVNHESERLASPRTVGRSESSTDVITEQRIRGCPQHQRTQQERPFQ